MDTMTIRKWGNGQGVRLTKSLLSQAGLRVGDELEVEVHDSSVILSPKHRRIVHPKDIDALFAGYDGSYTPREDEFARPVGRESL